MIIREGGIVVGKIDDETFELVDSESSTLTKLVEGWRKNPAKEFVPSEVVVEGARVDSLEDVPFTPENIEFYHNRLLIAGFEVQRA